MRPEEGDRRRVEVTLTPEGRELVAAKREQIAARARGGLRAPEPRRAQGRRPSAAFPGRRDRRAAPVTPHLRPEVSRAHPQRTLGILVLGAIAYALAQTMIIPALPAIQHEIGASPEAATWLLTAFLLTSSISPRCSAGSGTCTARRSCCWPRSPCSPPARCVGARPVDRGPDPRPRHPGRRRRDLPAGLRDHPRRVPARARGRLDRPDLGDLRHRRRPRPRPGRRDGGPPLGPLDLLVVGDRDGDRRLGHLALRARVARARARAASTGEARDCSRSRWPRCCSACPGQRLGLGLRRVLGLFAAALVLGAVFVAFERRVDEPMVDMRLCPSGPSGPRTSPPSRSASRCSAPTS